MSALLQSLRLLGDPTRVRILLLLAREELSVAELQEILGKGQSQISTHLSTLKRANFVEDRRNGKNILYSLRRDFTPAPLLDLLGTAEPEIAEARHDGEALQLVLEKRRDRMRSYFDTLAGRFGRQYLPGRSWQGLAEALLSLMPPVAVADLGAGEGTFSQLLARRAARVIAVDNSEAMVDFGTKLARKHQVENVEYRLGDMESVPIADQEVDIAFFSQSLHHALRPPKAVEEAFRILKPAGQIVILDLNRHNFEEARELYADIWLGFSELELRTFLKDAGFVKVTSAAVHREPDSPHFETLLVRGEKPQAMVAS
jgi:ubiquinone/menaquinone biosynthesis C-methylase UbiE/DNA-binding transcriptional ArsR family regulator